MQSLETLDNGKPFLDSVEDIVFAIETIEYYAGWCDKIHGQTIPVGTYLQTASNITFTLKLEKSLKLPSFFSPK